MISLERRPFVVMRVNEVETLDDLVPIIVYASPSLCKLLGYDQVHTRIARLIPPLPAPHTTPRTRRIPRK